jgi:hypothetical protein
LTVVHGCRLVALVEAQVGFAVRGIGPMATEASIGKQRSDIAVVTDALDGQSDGGSMNRQNQKRNTAKASNRITHAELRPNQTDGGFAEQAGLQC